MSNFIYIACSIDGYIARVDGNIDWLINIPNPENSDYGYDEFMNNVDAVLMGRNTFETVKEFNDWPYTKPVFVLSNTIKNVEDKYKNKIEIVRGDLKSIIRNINLRGMYNIYVDGGRTIQSFLREDLIDEMIITTISIILGCGIPLFGNNEHEIKFELVKTEKLNENMVKNYYKKRNRTTCST